jgi:hypothetical protein
LIKQFIAAASISLTASCGLGDLSRAAESAEAEVNLFHQRFDAGQFREIYHASANEMKQTVSEAQFIGFLRTIRERLGEAQESSRTQRHVNVGTAGSVVTLTHETRFARAPGVEQFVYAIRSGEARLVGYHVNSSALLDPALTREIESGAAPDNHADFVPLN